MGKKLINILKIGTFTLLSILLARDVNPSKITLDSSLFFYKKPINISCFEDNYFKEQKADGLYQKTSLTFPISNYEISVGFLGLDFNKNQYLNDIQDNSSSLRVNLLSIKSK